MKKRVILLIVCAFLGAALIGCDQFNFFKPAKKSQPKTEKRVVKGTLIAQVGNIPITLEDLNQEVEFFNANVPADKPEAKITTREQKVNFLKNEMVRRALLYQEALNRKLDSNEDIVNALEKTKRDLLVMDLVREETAKVSVSSKEVEDAYNQYKEQWKEPEERQIREIVVPTEQDARDILIQLLQGADFATLAKERSKSPSAKEGGDLGFVAKGKKSAQFDAVAFSDNLDVGRTSNIFRAPEGYSIIKLEAKRGGKQKSLTEMWDDIKSTLTFLKQQDKVNELIARLDKETRKEIYEGEVR